LKFQGMLEFVGRQFVASSMIFSRHQHSGKHSAAGTTAAT